MHVHTAQSIARLVATLEKNIYAVHVQCSTAM